MSRNYKFDYVDFQFTILQQKDWFLSLNNMCIAVLLIIPKKKDY